MPATASQYWLTGILGVLSIGSVVYTLGDTDIRDAFVQEREVESQNTIDTLTLDMSRLMKSISSWQNFCEDPYAYIQSATVHGNFTIAIKDSMRREDLLALSQIERDALARCSYTKAHPQSAQFRLCLSVKEANAKKGTTWFDQNHLFELNIQFREAGAKLISSCKDLQDKKIEVQNYFSAYTADGEIMDIKRISGGVRFPLRNGPNSSF